MDIVIHLWDEMNESKFPASITISSVMILEHIIMDKSSTEFIT